MSGGGAVPTLFQIMHAPQFFFAKFQKKYAWNIRVYTVYKILTEFGIPKKLDRVDQFLSDVFPIQCGLKQGYTESKGHTTTAHIYILKGSDQKGLRGKFYIKFSLNSVSQEISPCRTVSL